MILDGKVVSKKRKETLKQEVLKLIDIYHITPTLAIVRVGDDEASKIYVRNKIKAASFCNINTKLIELNSDILMENLLKIVESLNKDSSIHGIIVQLPLPPHINEQTIINAIADEKDVDGFGLLNKGKLFSKIPSIAPATPKGIIHLLEEYNVEIEGREAVVVGRSNIVGKPIAMLLLDKNATVTIAHSKTKNLKEVTKRADILVVAIGKAKFITADMVKENAVVIDVGINRIDNKLYGDVDYENVSSKVSYITPVPGGVGPLTIVTLLENTIIAYKNLVK